VFPVVAQYPYHRLIQAAELDGVAVVLVVCVGEVVPELVLAALDWVVASVEAARAWAVVASPDP
jgi:hypothetical protein